MTLWIVLAVVASFAAGGISAILWVPRKDHRRDASNEADISSQDAQAKTAGISIPPPVADSADAPVSARLLAGDRSLATVALAGIVVLVLVGLYASIASLEPTSDPSLTRSQGAQAVERLAALTRQSEITSPPPSPSPPAGALASVDDMIDRLAARLKQRPNDPEGWRMLGWSYFRTDRFNESAAAYLKAVELRPDFADFRSLRGEALVSVANGIVTPEATRAFDEALALNPADLRARFFKGLAKAQAGDKPSALADWIAIINEADPNEPEVAEIRRRATELGRDIGVDVSTRLRGRQSAANGDILRALAGPPASTNPPPTADGRAADTTTPSDQAAMIRGMVDSLSARLEQSPRDAEGWIKLMRSRVVLGETDQAKQALERALTIFDNASPERSQITAAAQELGIMR